jgi:hypothetical protein
MNCSENILKCNSFLWKIIEPERDDTGIMEGEITRKMLIGIRRKIVMFDQQQEERRDM